MGLEQKRIGFQNKKKRNHIGGIIYIHWVSTSKDLLLSSKPCKGDKGIKKVLSVWYEEREEGIHRGRSGGGQGIVVKGPNENRGRRKKRFRGTTRRIMCEGWGKAKGRGRIIKWKKIILKEDSEKEGKKVQGHINQRVNVTPRDEESLIK